MGSQIRLKPRSMNLIVGPVFTTPGRPKQGKLGGFSIRSRDPYEGGCSIRWFQPILRVYSGLLVLISEGDACLIIRWGKGLRLVTIEM